MPPIHRFEVSLRDHERDVRGEHVRHVAATLGIALPPVRVSDIYWLTTATPQALDPGSVERIAAAIIDPVTEVRALPSADQGFVEVALHPGVTDTVAETLARVARRLGVTAVAATGRRYTFSPGVPDESTPALPPATAALIAGTRARLLATVAERIVANPIIERWSIDQPLVPSFVTSQATSTVAEIIAVRGLSDDALVALSTRRRLALDLAEMRAIAAYFDARNRDPSDLELEMLAQTWSEHCVHKTFRAVIDLEETEVDGTRTRSRIDGLLKTFIRGATETLARDWVHSAFVDNAGIVALTDTWDIAIKVETHNHPSALEPFGGANTGMGGVIRDVLGVSARPFANLDVLCFAHPDTPDDELAVGALHPRRIADGVIHGIEDYGNKMGIPTVAGAVFYHPHYLTNPLVFCGTVGILPSNSHPTAARPGDLVVVLGGRTGRDGLRGATFSSLGMDATTQHVSGGAVQIGHPIAEKQVQEVVLRARDERLYTAITDCGAGGLSSAVGEMATGLGAVVELSQIPTKYPGLAPWELWLSEAQERMVLAVPEAHFQRLRELADEHGTTVTSIGFFGHETASGGKLRIKHRGLVVGDLELAFLHDGIPRRRLTATWQAPPPRPAPGVEDFEMGLANRLHDPNNLGREAVVRRYDHEVQGGTLVRPLVGPGDGPSDAAVVVPLELRDPTLSSPPSPQPAVAIAIGMDPLLGLVDPYAMAWSAIDEAIRNAVAVGADPERIAILDNFSWGDPRLPDRLGALARCARGCHDAALHYGTPFVSGKDSLNNEWTAPDGTRHAIPPTLVITAVGVVPDARFTVTSAFVNAGDALYVLGPTIDVEVPLPDAEAPHRYRALHRAIASGFVSSCHDASTGGLAVAVVEMSRGGQRDVDVDFSHLPGSVDVRPDRRPFAECPGRHLVCVPPTHIADFESLMTGLTFGRIGTVI